MIVLLWIGLVVALLVTLTICTVRLARKFFALVHDLADFVSLPAILDGVHRAAPEQRPTPAVLRSHSEVAAEHEARRRRAAEKRQFRSEQRLIRARTLVAVRVPPRDWFSS